MSRATIRVGNPADLAEIQRLNKALYDYEESQDFYQDSYDLEWTYSEAGTKYFQDRLSDSTGSRVFVAEIDGAAVGYVAASCRVITYRTAGPIAEIENMFVEAKYRRQGVGRALVEALRDWAGDQKATRLRVTAFTANHPAIGFYRKCGFHDFELTLEQ